MRGSVNIVEQHIEKLILVAAIGFAGYLGFVFFLGTPYAVEYRGQQVGPTELDEKILERAEELKRVIDRNSPAEPGDPIPQYSDQLEAQFKEGVFDVVGVLPRSGPFGTPLDIPGETPLLGNAIPIIRPLQPTSPVISSGRSFVDFKRMSFNMEDEEVDEMEGAVSWITVAAFWDREAQRVAHQEAGYVSYRQLPYMLPTEVERQELLPTGEWSDWELVRNSSAMPAFDIPDLEFNPNNRELTNKAEIDAAFNIVKSSQLNLIQPRFFDVISGDPWFIPELTGFSDSDLESREAALAEEEEEEGTNEVDDFGDDDRGERDRGGRDRGGRDRGGRDRGEREGFGVDREDRGERRPRRADRDAPRQLYHSALRAYIKGDDDVAMQDIEAARDAGRVGGSVKRNLDNLEKLIENRATKRSLAQPRWSGGEQQITVPGQDNQYAIWFHDTTVVPGKTYRYRIRACVWNRYLNNPIGLANPQDARLVVLQGEWSDPTSAIQAPPSHKIFISRTDPDRSVKANVWAWHRGWWFPQTFDAAIGDEIGSLRSMRMPLADPSPGENNARAEVDFSTGLYLVDVRLEEPRGSRSTDSRGGIKFDTPNTSVVVLLDPETGATKEQLLFKGNAPNPNLAGVARR